MEIKIGNYYRYDSETLEGEWYIFKVTKIEGKDMSILITESHHSGMPKSHKSDSWETNYIDGISIKPAKEHNVNRILSKIDQIDNQ